MEIFLTSLQATIKIFLITAFGYVFFKIKITNKLYKPLIFYTINIAIPILILYRLITKFDLTLFIKSLFLPLYGIFLIFSGYIIGKKLIHILNIPKEKQNTFIASIMFTNCGYLPLPLFQSIFTGNDIAISQIYVFFISIVYTLSIWSIGVNMLKVSNNVKKERFKLTPPFYAIILGILLSFFNTKRLLFPYLETVIKIIGESGVLLVMFMMGGGLSSVKFRSIKIDKPVVSIIISRLIIFPLIILPALLLFHIDSVLRIVLIVEAGVPPAVNLVIITQKYGNNKNIDFLLSVMITTYVISIFTLSFLIFVVQ